MSFQYSFHLLSILCVNTHLCKSTQVFVNNAYIHIYHHHHHRCRFYHPPQPTVEDEASVATTNASSAHEGNGTEVGRRKLMSLLFDGSRPSPVLQTAQSSSNDKKATEKVLKKEKPYDAKLMGSHGNAHQTDLLTSEESSLEWVWGALRHELKADKFNQAVTVGRWVYSIYVYTICAFFFFLKCLGCEVFCGFF
jgi:hypothetical protein